MKGDEKFFENKEGLRAADADDANAPRSRRGSNCCNGFLSAAGRMSLLDGIQRINNFTFMLFLFLAALSSSGRSFTAFTAGAIDQHLFK